MREAQTSLSLSLVVVGVASLALGGGKVTTKEEPARICSVTLRLSLP